MTYDDWLQMTDEERDSAHFGWDAYSRESIWVPYMAAARLAMMSGIPVLDLSVGTYHGGEYLLHMRVRSSDLAKCPQFPSQAFEGFRVMWLPDAIDEEPS